MFNQKGVIKNFARKSPVTESLFNKVLTFFYNNLFFKNSDKGFFCQFYEIFESTFFTEYFRATAFE